MKYLPYYVPFFGPIIVFIENNNEFLIFILLAVYCFQWFYSTSILVSKEHSWFDFFKSLNPLLPYIYLIKYVVK